MTPTVAVLIPTYNRAHLVGQTIDSMLNQTHSPDEIIVVDDGSTDETADVVGAFGHRIHYIKKENSGKAAALNRAMVEISSEYVWFMDDDDCALPNALEAHLDFLAAHTDIDFSYGTYYSFSGNGPPRMELLSSQDPAPLGAVAPEDLFVHAMLWFPFSLQSMLVPRRCYEQVGPFVESLAFTEDYEMILRLARYFRGGNSNVPTFCVRIHAGVRGPAHEQRSAGERHAAFRGYDRDTFARLYAELPLVDYLPRGSVASDELNGSQERQARLQRACIMSRHGLFDLAFDDLKAALDSRGESLLGAHERHLLTQMLNVEPWWLQAYPDYPASLGRLLRRHRAHEALQACAVGLGWQLEKSVHRGHYGEALRIGAQLRQLVGTARLPALAARALVQRHRRARA